MLIIICEGLVCIPSICLKSQALCSPRARGFRSVSEIRWETIESDTHHTHKQKGVIYILIKANTMLLHTFFYMYCLHWNLFEWKEGPACSRRGATFSSQLNVTTRLPVTCKLPAPGDPVSSLDAVGIYTHTCTFPLTDT